MSLRRLTALVYLLFFVSGLTGLVYQVAWVRMFGVVFGNTTHAVSTVLAAFMGGLALGSLLLGRAGERIGRPIRAYGILELLVGLFAFAFPWLLAALESVYAGVHRTFGENTVPLITIRFLMSFLMVLVPTTLMGGTLPVLSKFAARELPHVGRRIGALYAVNTLGAVIGTILAGFVLLEVLGVSRSVYLSAALNVGIGLLAMAVGSRIPEATGERGEAAPAPAAGPPAASSGGSSAGTSRVVLAAFAVSGALALAYEVLYTRVLVFTLGSSAHAFAVMLGTFLVGLALGSFVVSRFVDRWRNPAIAFGIVEVAVGLSVVGSVLVLAELARTHHAFGILRMGGGDLLHNRGASFLQAASTLLLPTLLLGATFPLVTRLLVRSTKDASRSIGRLYFYNTIGAVAGSLLAGFVLVPTLGTARSFALAAGANVAIGLLLFSVAGRRRVWIPAAVAVLGLTVAGIARTDPAIFARTFNIGHDESRLVDFREGVTGTVTIHRYLDYDLIAVDGVDVAGTSFMLRITQKLQAHLPVLMTGHPQRVAHIGFGTGETLRVLTSYDIPHIQGIEICRDIVAMSQRHFGAINRNAFERPEVHIVYMDGKNWTRLTGETYDTIMTDSVYPGVGHAGSALYTYDHFRAGRERLSPGGVLSCWLPLDMSPRDLRMILRSFHEAFPEMTVWFGWADQTQHALLLGRKDAPVEIDFARLMEAYREPGLRADLEEIGVPDPVELTSCLLLDGDGVAKLTEGIPLNTDDRPLLEFGIARRGITLNYLSANMDDMLAVRADPLRRIVNLEAAGADTAMVTAAIRERMEISDRVIRGHMAWLTENAALAQSWYRRALAIDPDDGVATRSLRRAEATVDALEQTAPAAADDWEAALVAGRRLLAARRLEAARGQFEQVLAVRPDAVEALRLLGECLFLEDRLDDAAATLRTLLAKTPRDDGALLLLGVCHERSGRAAEARDAYRAAVRANPDNYEARTNLGRSHLDTNELPQAREQFEAAHRLEPDKPWASFNLGVSYAQEGRWADAAPWFESAIELRPNFWRAHLELGKARLALGDVDGARQAWEQVLLLQPSNGEARRALDGLPRAG